jgi:hypothetical protein
MMNCKPVKHDDAIIPQGEVAAILKSHLELNARRPVSYLPIKTIEQILKLSVSEYVSLIERSESEAIVFAPENCCIQSGAVYAIRRAELERVLERNRPLLSQHQWPSTPADFVQKIASVWLDKEHPIMPAIRQAFGDS